MPDGETGRALLAGWISGAAVALATTALVLVAVSRDPAWADRLNRRRIRVPLIGVVVVNGMMLFWTLVGLMLGAIHLGVPQPAFSLALSAIVALGLLLFATIWGRPGWLTWSTVGVVLASFAGLLPALAGVG